MPGRRHGDVRNIAGLLTFVPYIGPIVAAVPAFGVALTQSASSAFYVGLLYTGVQVIENYVLTPVVQGRMVSLPPALLVAAGVLLGVLFGFFGLLRATPLTVACMILVQTLIVQDVLGDPVRPLGEGPAPD